MAQFARPDADQATGAWTATPLWSKVDEGATGDGVTITSADNSDPDDADLRLSDVSDPQDSAGHILRALWNKSASGGHAINAVLELYQGVPGTGTLVATLSVTGIGETPQTDTYTLSGAEADSITDYTDLYLRLSRQGDTGGPPGNRRSLVADYVELEVPDASVTSTGTVDVTLDDATASSSGSVQVSGSANNTLDDATLSSAGSVSVSGTADNTLQDATLSAAGSVQIAGSLGVTLDPATLSSSGTVQDTPVTGSLSVTLEDASVSASGSVKVSGVVSRTLQDATLASSGSVAITGSASPTLDGCTLEAAGSVGDGGGGSSSGKGKPSRTVTTEIMIGI